MQIAYPGKDVARITEIPLLPATPGQIRHRIEITGAIKILNRSPGIWEGSVTFGSRSSQAAASKMEAFLAALNGAENWTEIPIDHIKPSNSAGGGVVQAVNGSLQYTMSNPGRFDTVGNYWNAAGRLLIQTAVAPNVEFWPKIRFPVTTAIAPATYIRCRNAGDSPLLGHTPHWSGPWTWQFVEHIG